MRTTAVIALKGGTGKSVCAMALSEAAARGRGSALLVDADPQSSSILWARQAEADGLELSANIVGLPTYDLSRRMTGLGVDRYPYVVIDTPPGDERIARSALEVADVALCPVRPSAPDMIRLWDTLDLAAEVGTPALVVLTMTRPRTRSLEAATEVLAANGARVAQAQLPLREAIANAYGRPVDGVLADIGTALLAELDCLPKQKRKGNRAD